MPVGKKYDHPPLMAPGRHYTTLEEIWEICVARFNEAGVRRNHYYRLEQLAQDLLIANIPCDIWIDGSILTEKMEPSDLDVTVIIDQDVNENLTDDQRQLVDRINSPEYADKVDSFVFVRLRRDDPDYGIEGIDSAFDWGEQYGRENGGEWLKGFAVLRVRETDVGLFVCR